MYDGWIYESLFTEIILYYPIVKMFEWMRELKIFLFIETFFLKKKTANNLWKTAS